MASVKRSKKMLPVQEIIPAPESKKRYFKLGWVARMKGRHINSGPEAVNPVGRSIWRPDSNGTAYNNSAGYRAWEFKDDKEVDRANKSWERHIEWRAGYIAAGRAIGKQHVAVKEAQETAKINAEHDLLAELSKEFAA